MEGTETKVSYNLPLVFWLLIGLSALLVVFSFFAPRVFSQPSTSEVFFNENTGSVGDTIGGIMTPFIALAGVIITFLAFFIQYQANQIQVKNFREESNWNRFENQFYEMLRLHKENVNELSIPYKGKEDVKISGRDIFLHLNNELKISYYLAKDLFTFSDPRRTFELTFELFFLGNNPNTKKLFKYSTPKMYDRYIFILHHFCSDGNKIETLIRKFNDSFTLPQHILLSGRTQLLGPYFRHLFHIVSFVVNHKLLNYPQKRSYLKILRAQLSNEEQVMLFYNWYSGFGQAWENDENHFFTDFRMIHNLHNVIFDISLNAIPEFHRIYQKRTGHDPLFEFYKVS